MGNMMEEHQTEIKKHRLKKAVVLVVFTLQGGGAERFVLTMAQAFTQMGYQAHIITFKSQIDYPLPENIHYHSLQPYRFLPRGTFRYQITARMFDRYVRKHIGTPELILSNLWQVDKILRYSALNNIIHVLHNTVSYDFQLNTDHPTEPAAYIKEIYSRNPLAAVSRGVMKDYQEQIDKNACITAILNPTDQTSIIQASQSFIPNYQSPYLIHIGRFFEQKDHNTLIRAYAQSKQTMPLILLGRGKLMENCQALAKELGVSGKVIFAGFQANPYPFIKHAAGLILSSRFEGFGLVLAEALALGVPAISTDCPSGPSELLPPHCLTPVGDVNALAEKINALMDNPAAFKALFNDDWLPEKAAQHYLNWVRQNNMRLRNGKSK